MVMTMAPEDPSAAALYRLMAWLSPSYPVGAFSYSSGIEWAVEASDITDADSLRRWLAVVVGEGGGFCDAVFFVHAHRSLADTEDTALRTVAELAAAIAPSKERHLETTAQGAAFIEATKAAWPCPALDRLAAAWTGPVAYPVAVGVNAKYLLELLGQMNSDGVRIEMAGELDPILVRPLGDPDYLGVIMPMRI